MGGVTAADRAWFMFAAAGRVAGRALALMPVSGGYSRCWWLPGLVTCFVPAWFWFSRVQHDEGDADGDGGCGQQGAPGDVFAEQPPAQDDGDERADECIGAGELAGCVMEQPFVGAVAQQAAEDDEIPKRQARC
jgi:hypothetical protein